MSDNILRGKIYKKLHMIEKLYIVMTLEKIIMELMTFEVDPQHKIWNSRGLHINENHKQRDIIGELRRQEEWAWESHLEGFFKDLRVRVLYRRGNGLKVEMWG